MFACSVCFCLQRFAGDRVAAGMLFQGYEGFVLRPPGRQCRVGWGFERRDLMVSMLCDCKAGGGDDLQRGFVIVLRTCHGQHCALAARLHWAYYGYAALILRHKELCLVWGE